jgi:hypothetical protein
VYTGEKDLNPFGPDRNVDGQRSKIRERKECKARFGGAAINYNTDSCTRDPWHSAKMHAERLPQPHSRA